jgi:hypothetical protein
MTEHEKTAQGKLLEIQTLEGFRRKALPQLLEYLATSGYTVVIAEDENNNDNMKCVTFYQTSELDDLVMDEISMSDDFLSGLIFFANSIHHSVTITSHTIENEDNGYFKLAISAEFHPKHHSEVF